MSKELKKRSEIEEIYKWDMEKVYPSIDVLGKRILKA